MTDESQNQSLPLTGQEEGFMRAFTRAILRVSRALDDDLLRERSMSMSEYAALMHLSESPGRRLRMTDLACVGALSLSGMTRIVNRLEEQGLVRRERSAADGRSRSAILTDAGLERLREAWPAHLASVRRHVFDHLETSDLAAFTAALEHFAEGAEPSKDQ